MIKKIFIISIFLLALPLHKTQATAYFIDLTSNKVGCSPTTGTATTTSFCSLDQFAEVARSAGDIAFVRRGNSTTTQSTSEGDLNPTSSGTKNNPITISADYDNMWNDDATTTETYTVTFGSKTMTPSASSTTAFIGKWIYVQGDCNQNYSATTVNQCLYAYEIASATSGTLTLYFPYKGNQSGAGLKLRVMRQSPQWGVKATTNHWTFNTANLSSWFVKGIGINSSNAACAVAGSADMTNMMDMTFQGSGVADCGFTSSNEMAILRKTRMFGQVNIFKTIRGGLYQDILGDCNSVASSFAINSVTENESFIDAEFKNCTTFSNGSNSGGLINADVYFRNVKYNNVYTVLSGSQVHTKFYFEDQFGTVGLNSTTNNLIGSLTQATTTMATTTNLRSGGGPLNQVVFPPSGTGNTGISTNLFPESYIKLFEYPIYADTSSKTYSMFFNSTSTAQWTANPTALELYIECEYYGSASSADRKLTKSTQTAAFSSATAWQTLSVTCQPAQSGILYLRGWYAKPLESNKSNWFYMDNTPLIQ